MPEPPVVIVIRVGNPGGSAFQLRKGEEGLSVFDQSGTDPELTDDEVLAAFRPGSVVIHRTADQVTALGLVLVPSEGADSLPERLRAAHREIRPGPGMSRAQFKTTLKELE